MYKTVYDWSSSDYSGFANFLKYLYEESCNYYRMKQKNFSEKIKGFSKIEEFVQDIEHYLYYLIKLGYVDKGNIYDILKRIMSIKLIRLLGVDENIYVGYTENNVVSLNPNIQSNDTLTGEERSLLFGSHEYGHVVNSRWSNRALATSQSLWSSTELRNSALKYGYDSLKYFFHGIKLLDEAITQDVAENVTYAYAEKMRPKKTYHNSKELFNGKSYVSNFEIYGDFQEVAAKFARLINFINADSSMSIDEVLYKLSKESMNKNFLRRIILDIFSQQNNNDFYLMVCCMGLLKDAHYQLAKLNEFSDSKDRSAKSLQLFNNLSSLQYQKSKRAF